jgi:hypothetical protein
MYFASASARRIDDPDPLIDNGFVFIQQEQRQVRGAHPRSKNHTFWI